MMGDSSEEGSWGLGMGIGWVRDESFRLRVEGVFFFVFFGFV